MGYRLKNIDPTSYSLQDILSSLVSKTQIAFKSGLNDMAK